MANNDTEDVQDVAEGGVPEEQQDQGDTLSSDIGTTGGLVSAAQDLGLQAQPPSPQLGVSGQPLGPQQRQQTGWADLDEYGQPGMPGQDVGMPRAGGFRGFMQSIERGLQGGLNLGGQGAWGANEVQQRHGGLATGLLGVLLDGLAGGMAPDRRTAMMMPMLRQEQQQKSMQLQLQTAKLQEELREAPNREAAQMMKTMLDYTKLRTAFINEKEWNQTGLSTALQGYVQKMMTGNHGKITMTGTPQQVMSYIGQEAQNGHHNLFPVPSGIDGQEESAFEVDDDPNNILTEPIQGSFDYEGQPIQYYAPAGLSGKDAHAAVVHEVESQITAVTKPPRESQSEMGARLEREAAQQGKKPWEYQPWKDFAQSQELLAQGKPSTQKVTPRRDIYGTAVGQLPSGDWAFSTAFQKEADKFNQQYLIGKNGVLPLLNSAERLQQIIDKITVRDQNGNPVLGRDGKPQLDARKLTGADSIVGLLDAVGVSIIGTGGSARVTAPMIEGHEHARGWIEDLRALVQKYAAHGGPATPQQLRDYESVMSQALQTSYQNAIDAAGLMGPEGSSLGLDWLPKGHNQRINPNSAVDQAIVRIYAVGANQDPEGTVRAMEANGWNMN